MTEHQPIRSRIMTERPIRSRSGRIRSGRGSLPSPRTASARIPRLALVPAVVLLAGLALTGCTPEPDPAETVEALTEVRDEPSAPDAAEELSVERMPDPIVDPLDCSPYLVLTVRGTGEPGDNQLVTPVAKLISESRPDEVQVVDLDYPASGEVKESATIGVRTLIDTLNVQAEACPDQRVALLGYSQGALVIGDALSPAETRLVGGTVGSVSEAAAERVLAIVLYGDPRFVGSKEYNVGDYDPGVNGLLPRVEGGLEAFAERIHDYCVARDFVCQSSFDLDEKGHVTYFKNGMQQDGAAFVITRLDPPRSDGSGDADGVEATQEAPDER